MGKKRSRASDLLNLLMPHSVPDKGLPKGSIKFCLKCKMRTTSLNSNAALCTNCYPTIKPEELKLYERLVRINSFDEYPTASFLAALDAMGLNQEILEAYFKAFGLQAYASGINVVLSPNQRGRNLNILFNNQDSLYEQSVKNLIVARQNSEYDDKVAAAEGNKFLKDRFDVTFEDINAAKSTLSGFDFQIPAEYDEANKLFRKAAWSDEHNSATTYAKTILKLLPQSEEITKLNNELKQKYGFGYEDVKDGQAVIEKFQIKALEEIARENQGLVPLNCFRRQGDTKGEIKYLEILQELAQIPNDFELLSNKHGLNLSQTQLAQETAREIVGVLANRQNLDSNSENPYLKILTGHAEFLGTSREATIRRFIAIVRTYIDPQKKHTCGTWIYYLLVKSRLTLWLQLMDNFEDPDQWMFKVHCFPKPEEKSESSNIPEWGFGPPPLSSLGSGGNSRRRYN